MTARHSLDYLNAARVSRVLSEALASGRIALADATVGTKSRRYVPYWAAPQPASGGDA